MQPTTFFTILILSVCCVFWVWQFVQLMLLSEAYFPGRYDKYLWTAAFIFTFILAPFAFFVWKHAYRAMLSAQAASKHAETRLPDIPVQSHPDYDNPE